MHKGGSISEVGKTQINYTLDNSYDKTDLNVTYDPTATYTGSAETDIIYYVNVSAMPNSSADGFVWCDDPVSQWVCDQHYVAFRYASPGIPLSCHETGHAVGLTHGNDAYPIQAQQNDPYLRCMETPVDDQTLGSHNAAQIDGAY